jgi:predicted transcriptional regulator
MPSNESTTTLHITYRDETLRDRGRDALERAVDGEEYDPIIQVNLTELHDLARLMTEENLALLTVIVERRPQSISDLAAAVDRDYKSVHRNLRELEEFGVLEFESSGNTKRPLLRGGADEFEVEVSVHRLDGEETGHNPASV